MGRKKSGRPNKDFEWKTPTDVKKINPRTTSPLQKLIQRQIQAGYLQPPEAE